jgi:hypothetical protein
VWRVKNPDCTQGQWLRHTRSDCHVEDEEDIPVECPFDCGKEDECLKRMLNDNPGPIILDPATADCFCERYAKSGTHDKYGITESQRARISREHGGKLQVERRAVCFYASDVCANCPYEDRDPKEHKEPLF